MNVRVSCGSAKLLVWPGSTKLRPRHGPVQPRKETVRDCAGDVRVGKAMVEVCAGNVRVHQATCR